MNLESQISNPERLNAEQNRQSLPEVDLSLLRPNLGPETNSAINVGAESKELQADAQAVVSDTTVSSTSVPIISIQPAPASSTQLKDFATPDVAADLDVIEQGWVDVTKQVLASTTDDPRMREEKIKDLQADYLLKRYGRIVGASNNPEENKV